MKPIRIITLTVVCAVALTCVQAAHAQVDATCTITGTIYQVDGYTPAAGATLTVTRADKAGKLFANTSRVYTANSNGIVSFKAPRTVGTDTAVIHVRASFGNLASGQILYVPSDSTATLESLVRYTANPQFVVVAMPAGSADTLQNGKPRLTRIENDLGQFTPSTSDSLQQAQADAKLALNVGQGKAGADSVHTVLVALSNLIAGKGGADSIHSQLVTLYNLVAGKPNADSVHSAIDAMLRKADTTALHAQRFAVINDSLLAVSLRATSTANDLTAHIGTADAHLPSQTGASGKFLQSNGTVSSWQTALTAETDPTALAKASSALDSALSGGARSVSTTGRMFASDDSITFVGEAGDIINAALGNVFRGTLSANDTLSITGMVDGQVITVIITNAGTHTLGWTGVNWAGGTVPTLSATANKRDAFTVIRAGGIMYGSAVQDLR